MARRVDISKAKLKEGMQNAVKRYSKIAKTNKFNVFVYLNIMLYGLIGVLFILMVFGLI